MIIMIRGNHGSGKSTVMRNIIRQMTCVPIFGILGPKVAEACSCQPIKGKNFHNPVHILGPYDTSPATAGADYITKKGVEATVKVLEKYRSKGTVLFESAMMSARFMEPSVGKWLTEHKDEVLAATLTTTTKQCLEAIQGRQKKSINKAHDPIHFEAQDHMVKRVTELLKERGFRVEYVSREDAPDKVMGWLREKP